MTTRPTPAARRPAAAPGATRHDDTPSEPAMWREALRRDDRDPLPAGTRAFDTGGTVHLNGNSLGPPADGLVERLTSLVRDQWVPHQVEGWFREGWLDLPRTVGDKIATLLGAAPGQVVVAGETTSTTLFGALVAACRLRPDRPLVLVEGTSFPTDLYIADSVARLLGREVLTASGAEVETVLRERGGQVAVTLTAPVDFRTGERRDVGTTTALAHTAGAVAVWDVSHAAGVLPVDLDAAGVDLAVGCGYKYLCGGPGAPAFLYVPTRLQSRVELPLAGWHGHARPFAMAPTFEAAPGIDGARTGTPPVLSLAALDHALDPLVAVGVPALRDRSRRLAEFFVECLAHGGPDLSGRLASPRDGERRGGHLALSVPDAGGLEEALAERGVRVDSRPPDLVRFAFAPLHVTFEQVWSAVRELRGLVAADAGGTAR